MEMIYAVAGWRAPFVMVNVSRGLATPITLESDHGDVLAARDSGFLQIHCATCQEVLDTVLMAYRLAEDTRTRLPVIVNLDGFYLSFTREPVEIPDPDSVREFLPPHDPQNARFRASAPASQGVAVLGGSPYSYFRYEAHLAALRSIDVYGEVAAEFEAAFGRRHDAIDAYRCDDAEIVFVMIGSFATKAKAAVDQLRDAGFAVGLVRLRLVRPFPVEDLRRVVAGKRGIAVIDQNLSMGRSKSLDGKGWRASCGGCVHALRALRRSAHSDELHRRSRWSRHQPGGALRNRCGDPEGGRGWTNPATKAAVHSRRASRDQEASSDCRG
jgi:pyruvate ferredoxin oxidoreductase alpha subunit